MASDELGPVARALLEALKDAARDRAEYEEGRGTQPPFWWLDLAPGERLILEDRTRWRQPALFAVRVLAIGEPNLEVVTLTKRKFSFSFDDSRYRIFAYDAHAWKVIEDGNKETRALQNRIRELRKSSANSLQYEIRQAESTIQGIRQHQQELAANLAVLSDYPAG